MVAIFAPCACRGLAEALWHEAFIPEPTLDVWMRGSAKRAKMWNGSVVSTASGEEHGRDLIEAGILTPVD